MLPKSYDADSDYFRILPIFDLMDLFWEIWKPSLVNSPPCLKNCDVVKKCSKATDSVSGTLQSVVFGAEQECVKELIDVEPTFVRIIEEVFFLDCLAQRFL